MLKPSLVSKALVSPALILTEVGVVATEGAEVAGSSTAETTPS
jgi:hypothetical protein